MSDFGFDAYAFDDVDTVGHPHPLEIARDLIAMGKPRSALEVLSLHHEQLADDPEYLMLCSEAWCADGDTLRAQQALLGAARLAPKDPRPLQWLGELLAERGEPDKAERLLAKARALEALSAEESLDGTGIEAEDDLIAYAERRERSHQAALTPKQVLLGAAAVVGVVSLVGGIARLTHTDQTGPPTERFAPAPAATRAEPAVPSIADSEPPPTSPAATGEPDRLEDPSPVPVALAASRKAASPPRGSAALKKVPAPPDPKPPSDVKTAKAKAKSKSKPKKESVAAPHEPDAAVVEAELASMDPRQLTVRADRLYAQGHSGLAASYYRRALEIDPDYAPALVGIGQSILRAEKYSEAMRNATRALELARGVDARPGLEAVAIYQLGRVHYERGERDAARRLFRQSISLPGTPGEAWFYLGEALSSDNSPAAREAYEKYLELVPEGHLAARARRAIQ